MKDTLDKIRSFADLPPGWDYGEGAAISVSVIRAAVEMVRFLVSLGASKIDASPDATGGVLVAASLRGQYTEVILGHDGLVTVAWRRFQRVSGLSRGAARRLLSRLATGEVI